MRAQVGPTTQHQKELLIFLVNRGASHWFILGIFRPRKLITAGPGDTVLDVLDSRHKPVQIMEH